MAAEIESYPLDQLFNRIRKKTSLHSTEFQSVNSEKIESILDLKHELTEKLKSIRISLENNE